MLFMIGVYRDNVNEVMGFRIIDINSMEIRYITYSDISSGINDGRLLIENLYIDYRDGNIRECGDRIGSYTTIKGKEIYLNKAVTIVGVNNKGNIMGVSGDGALYNISEIGLRNVDKFGINITNRYILRGGKVLRGGTIIEERNTDRNNEANKKIHNYLSKCAILNQTAPIIKSVGGNITLLAVDKKIKKMNIPSFVTHIGSSAFEDCYNLDEVIIHNNVKYIGDNAFGMCKSLRYIEIPESVQEIGIGVFSRTGLKGINIKAKIKKIPSHTFNGCYDLVDIKLPDTIEVIGECVYMLCSSINSVVIPNNIKEIGKYAFSGSGITDVTVECKIEELPEGIFNECFKLEKVKIPSSIKNIKDCAFRYCENLEVIDIIGEYGKLEYIAPDAFYRCDKFKGIGIIDKNDYIRLTNKMGKYI